MSHPYLISHAAAIGPADETFLYGAFIDWLQATVVSSSSVGNRQIQIDVLNAAGTVILSLLAGAVQAASLTKTYTVAPELNTTTAFISGNITMAIPRFFVPAGGKIRIKDAAAIDAPTDTIAFTAGVRPL